MQPPSSCRVALVGFGAVEHQALLSCLRPVSGHEPQYDLTASLVDADLIITDGDSPEALATVMKDARTRFVMFIGNSAPPGALCRVPRPIDRTRILRSLDGLVDEHRADFQAAREVVDLQARATAKAKVRRAVRRAQQAGAASHADSFALTDVLVLDADVAARDHLGGLLERFGFTVHTAPNMARAADLLDTRHFVAVFLDIVLDDSDHGEGVALCRLARDLNAMPVRWTPALVLVNARAQAIDAIRAKLAGADVLLPKPLARGDVARALVDCGVALPIDARA